MKIKNELQPVLTKDKKERYTVCFWFAEKRFRYSSANVLGLNLYPNQSLISERKEQAEFLLTAFKIEIQRGWRPNISNKPTITSTVVEVCKKVLPTEVES